jgi:hypothetical protein
MTAAFRPPAPSRGYAIDCHRAVIQAYARSVATVLTVRGVVDSLNETDVDRHLSRFNRLGTALILDITEAKVADPSNLCRSAVADAGAGASEDASTAVVARPEQAAALRAHAGHEAPGIYATVADAVQFFVCATQSRRDPSSVRILRPA